MSFRDNLQYLRTTRNMTQEQLAMLLGVSRQSVSKWEAERAYPEMDKLIRLCDLFGCSIDELVKGDLTARPPEPAASTPTAVPPQDVAGYDEAMLRFSWRLPLGVAVVLVGLAGAALLQGASDVPGTDPNTLSAVSVFLGVAAGVALIVPAAIERASFQRAHPLIEDFYTAQEHDAARRTLTRGLVSGIALIMAALAGATLLQADERAAGGVFFLLVAAGTFLIVHGAIAGSRCDLAEYNRDSLGDMDEERLSDLEPETRARARRARRENNLYGGIMCVATAIGLLLLFVPAFHAQTWFWVAWPVGGVLCGAVAAFAGDRGWHSRPATPQDRPRPKRAPTGPARREVLHPPYVCR